MKVAQLIAGSTFTPGPARSDPEPPRVTIILPTFRRGDSGLLGRTIDSLLGQSFTDFELIIVDDASTDSSAAVIANAMRRDRRVSVIRHDRNIGLPAVSEYEAYVRARGELISFSFDDTVMYRHALRRLVRESDRYPDAVIAGYVTTWFRTPDGELFSQPLGAGVEEADLLARNVIPNNAVVAPRSVLDVVGLFDPHVSLARLCDYDLWLRVRRRFEIRFVDTCIGEEFGPSTTDSLGHTYPLDDWATDDRMRQRRDAELTPARFADLDVFTTEDFASRRSREVVGRLVARHLESRPWMTKPARPATRAQRVPRVLVVAAGIAASTQLYFEGLRDAPSVHVRIIDPRSRTVRQLVESDVLIVSRHLVGNADWLEAARALGVPVHYFLDDNFPLMAEGRELDPAGQVEFELVGLRKRMQGLNGVLTSTETLAASLRDHGLHATVEAVELVAPEVVAEWAGDRRRGADTPITVALFVGPHRLREIRAAVWPALVEIGRATGRRLRLLVPASSMPSMKRLIGRDHVELVPYPVSTDYFIALRTLRDLGVDVVIVPPTTTVNAGYKSLHPLLTAGVLGAHLVVPAAPPYLELLSMRGVSFVDTEGTSEQWLATLSPVIAAVAAGEDGVPAELLVGRFGVDGAVARFRTALHGVLPAAEPDENGRLRVLADHVIHQLAVARTTYRVPAAGPGLGSATAAFASDLQTTLRSSRRLHAFRGRSRRLPGVQFADAIGGNGTAELGAALTGRPYVNYRLLLEAGAYLRVEAMVWADGAPGDLIGVEVVGPEGRIRLHSATALPQTERPVVVSLDARRLVVDEEGWFEVRVFARTDRLAFVLEKVDRGPWGLRRPHVTPLLHFERALDRDSQDPDI